jgi:phage-related protein
VTSATASQTWKAGTTIDLVLPATTFHDPQGQAMAYTAHLSTGQALPSWLSFNATTETFTGTAPTAAQTLNIVVTATDTSGLSVSETFAATVIGTPVVAAATANQTWTEGQAISLTLPAGTFSDPQGQALTYTATLANGQALPSWLTFHAATDSFTGTAPATAQSLSIKVTATDTSGLSTSETFAAAVQPAPVAVVRPSIAVTSPTANQVWTDGQAVDLVLPGNTFTDALGLPMTFTAFEVSGPSVTSWLRFNSSTDTFSGTAPANASGPIGLAVVATDAAHLSAVDLFSVSFQSAAGHTTAALTQLSVQGLSAQFVTEPATSLIGFHS